MSENAPTNAPLFSVIIPSYNRANLIGQTLDSILQQSFISQEIIVVDDGSTDGTLELLTAYAGKVKLLRQANKGPGAARNLGLSEAAGEYVAFLDSDDLWFPWTAQTYANVIRQHNQPAFIAGKPFIFREQLSPPAVTDQIETNAFTDYYASGDQWRWYSASSFVMKRTALLEVGGFTNDWINGEDADLTMRMGTQSGFVQIVSPPTFAYRQHAGSAMANLDKTLSGVRNMLRQHALGNYPGGKDRSLQRERIISTHTRPMALEMLKQGNRNAAWELYHRTFKMNQRLGRWKFLLAFPAKAATSRFLPRRKQ